jgi:hypothetical protein
MRLVGDEVMLERRKAQDRKHSEVMKGEEWATPIASFSYLDSLS